MSEAIIAGLMTIAFGLLALTRLQRLPEGHDNKPWSRRYRLSIGLNRAFCGGFLICLDLLHSFHLPSPALIVFTVVSMGLIILHYYSFWKKYSQLLAEEQEK